MDPTNNPTSNPNPVSTSGTTPVPGPVQPTTNVPPASSGEPTPPSTPVQPTVNPIVNPTGAVPVNPVFQPSSLNGVSAMDPIMRPEPAPAPDPVEEELKAPMKAAGPVPGSIGSAVSGPELAEETEVDMESVFVANNAQPSMQQNNTPSVSFNDPATQPDVNPATEPSKPVKKNSKTTLTILIVVAIMVVIALAAVLIFELMGNNGIGQSNASDNSSTQSSNSGDGGNGESPVTPTPEPKPEPTPVISDTETIVCTATQETLEKYSDDNGIAKSLTMTLNFKDNKITEILVDATAVTSDGIESTKTTTYTAAQLFALSGVSQAELEEEGIEFYDDGSVSLSRAQLMSALNELDGYVCSSPNQL